ncbi:hypothetical protein MRX96_006771 [Rhipicephalus microplus]
MAEARHRMRSLGGYLGQGRLCKHELPATFAALCNRLTQCVRDAPHAHVFRIRYSRGIVGAVMLKVVLFLHPETKL